MADNKKYYYMRLKENFFETEEMVMLESMQDGILYSNILIKLYLKSLKSDGRLLFKDTIPYNAEMISTVTRHSVGVVEKALKIFAELDLISLIDGQVLYMNDIELLVGKTSTEGDRKRKARAAIDSGEMKGLPETKKDGQNADKCPPEIRVKSIELKDNIKDNGQNEFDRMIEQQFEEFWKVYYRREKKQEAKKSFIKAVKKDSIEKVMHGTYEYIKVQQQNGTDKKYLPHPTTFLNQAVYLDDMSEYVRNKNISTQNKVFNPWEVNENAGSTNQTNLFDNSSSIPNATKVIGFGSIL